MMCRRIAAYSVCFLTLYFSLCASAGDTDQACALPQSHSYVSDQLKYKQRSFVDIIQNEYDNGGRIAEGVCGHTAIGGSCSYYAEGALLSSGMHDAGYLGADHSDLMNSVYENVFKPSAASRSRTYPEIVYSLNRYFSVDSLGVTYPVGAFDDFESFEDVKQYIYTKQDLHLSQLGKGDVSSVMHTTTLNDVINLKPGKTGIVVLLKGNSGHVAVVTRSSSALGSKKYAVYDTNVPKINGEVQPHMVSARTKVQLQDQLLSTFDSLMGVEGAPEGPLELRGFITIDADSFRPTGE